MTRRYYGTFDPASPAWPVPKVRVLLYIPNITTSWKSVDFLVDTGASRTLLNPTEALLQVGFTRQQLTEPQPWPVAVSQGVGGQVRNYLLPAFYGFLFADDSEKVLSGQIWVASYSDHAAKLPSLLGWDVLQHFRLTTDWQAKTVFLDELSSAT